jgi:hypothetical protein
MERILQRKRKMRYERQVQKKMVEEWKKGTSKRGNKSIVCVRIVEGCLLEFNFPCLSWA